MKVFIIGGGGFIGGGCARAFRKAGHDVTTLSRTRAGAEKSRAQGVRALEGDMTRAGPWLNEMTASDIVVYAAQPRAGKKLTQKWIEESRAARNEAMKLILPALQRAPSCKAFLLTSGIVVVGDHGDEPITETTSRTPSALGDFHAESEAMARAAVARGVPAVVLRPGFVYGPDGTFAEFFIKEAKKGFYPYPGDGANFIPWVHIDDLGDSYVLASLDPPIGETLHLVDDEPMRLRDFARLLIQEAGGGRSMGMPKWLVSFIAGAPLVQMLTASYRADNNKAKRLLGWSPRRRTVREGLPDVFSAFSDFSTHAPIDEVIS